MKHNRLLFTHFYNLYFLKLLLIIPLFLTLAGSRVYAQRTQDEMPIFGAEIFIEPGQTPEEIDTWFKRLQESGMQVTRVRMFEYYMHKPDGSWDYSLFDMAFKAADKYKIKVYANIFPNNVNGGIEKFHFPATTKHLNDIAVYIKNCVEHFKGYKSLYGWVPMNEPGATTLTADPFTVMKFAEWKKVQPKAEYNSSGYNSFKFEEERFLVDFDIWWLNWLTEQIKSSDPKHLIHVNNHDIFRNAAEYRFQDWRKFINSLGGSAHASWHFGYFDRQKYTFAMAANSEMLRSGAGELPWLMTEIQGGNNTYSGKYPMCPTADEVTQWLWTIQGCGSKGSIFWSLNPRGSNVEAGEWGMLNFLNQPSDRLIAASNVIKTITKDSTLFKSAKVLESGINILYTRESMWVEDKLLNKESKIFYEGRTVGGVMKSALSYFEALTEMGVQANLKEIEEFDFNKSTYSGVTIILSHQVSIPSKNWPDLERFVAKGGKLLVDGLTAYYDENAHCIMINKFPLKELFGGQVKEFKVTGNLFPVAFNNQLLLTAHLWQGTIEPAKGQVIASAGNEAVAIRNTFGLGSVTWIPSMVGLGSRISGSYTQLAKFLLKETEQSMRNVPLRFKTHEAGLSMKLMKSGSSYIAILCNTNATIRKFSLMSSPNIKSHKVLFTNKNGSVTGDNITINGGETIVIQFN
ncbi:MAG: hypothetical protein EOO88_10590 [Pedobacter sp.]|nr:MAG: hypothetical protein EOO88_10590 [Pedobacter sp.]